MTMIQQMTEKLIRDRITGDICLRLYQDGRYAKYVIIDGVGHIYRWG